MKTEKQKMLDGELYDSSDEELLSARKRAKRLCTKLNNGKLNSKKRIRIAKRLLGKTGENIDLTQGFYCDYGTNIEVGENFYCNFGVCILDVCKVKIGDNCLIGPQVGIYTACHPLDRQTRVSLLEYGKPITIGNDCWIGGHAVINGGVALGDNVVVGSGSVVTKSFPSNVVIAGNPAKIIKYL
ncbi:MAG: sugar O-acetyltransferase [Clostridia bacterium]|nr:sugar O-acetyltransferase [Clostridia bacterium]